MKTLKRDSGHRPSVAACRHFPPKKKGPLPKLRRPNTGMFATLGCTPRRKIARPRWTSHVMKRLPWIVSRAVCEFRPKPGGVASEAVAHARAGVLAYERSDCPAAAAHFERAREQTANNQRAYSIYGSCLLARQHVAQAVSVSERLSAGHPDSPSTRFDLARAHLLAVNPADAIALRRLGCTQEAMAVLKRCPS